MKKEVLKENVRPIFKDIVKVKEMGNITEVLYSQHRKSWCSIKKLNNDEYLDYKTGEVKNFEHIENRSEDLNSVRVSLGKGRDLLNTNIVDVTFCRWLTLTYSENMTDTIKLYKDFEKFIKKARYKYGKFEYIVFMEPQERGAWHCHVVMIFPYKAPFIPNNELAEIWGNGFITIKKLDSVDNVGAYITAYLGDIEASSDVDINNYIKDGFAVKEVDIEDDSGKIIKKKFIKGARLHLYPPKFNLYRTSKGIKKPEINYMKEEDARKKVSEPTLTFERTVKLFDETGFNNVLNYRYYNKVRNKSQEVNGDRKDIKK